jgi:hypothetical protein
VLRNPRVLRRPFGGLTQKIAELIDLEVEARIGSNASFEQQQDAAATIAAEVLVEFAKAQTRGPKAEG